MTFKTGVEDRYFEDYVSGDVHEFGAIAVEEAEMIAFARRFDPQPFHTDPAAARESAFGGLIASGWYTVNLTMRLLVDHYISRVAGLGSPGVDEIRWLKPVRPGDTLSVRATVLTAKLSRSKPNQGTVRSYVEVLNQHREVVMTWQGMGLVRCRANSGDTILNSLAGQHRQVAIDS
jgi:acyl dehydratase